MTNEEKVQEFKWVEVSDDNETWQKRIFVADLGNRFSKPIVVVAGHHSSDFLNGENHIATTNWGFMREMQEKSPIEEKAIELGFKERIFNSTVFIYKVTEGSFIFFYPSTGYFTMGNDEWLDEEDLYIKTIKSPEDLENIFNAILK